jgi:ribosomal protein S18 acetylase RimI-like enzyme
LPTTSIRPAIPADATHLACFVDMASEGLAEVVWEAMRGPAETLFEVGRSRALREEGAFSYRNALIAEIGGAVAGGLVCYRIADEPDPDYRVAGDPTAPQLPAFVHALIELEAMVPGHWYVNILATYPEYRGKGVASALLKHADALGRANSAKGLALVVDLENTAARSVYAAAGYREFARRPLAPFPMRPNGSEWLLLTRPNR